MIKLMEYLNDVEKHKSIFQRSESPQDEKSAYIAALNKMSETVDFNAVMEEIINLRIKEIEFKDNSFYSLKEKMLKINKYGRQILDILILVRNSTTDGDYIWIFGLPYNIVVNISYDVVVTSTRCSYFENINFYYGDEDNHITMLTDYFIK